MSRFQPEGGLSWAESLPTSSSRTCHSEPCSSCTQSQPHSFIFISVYQAGKHYMGRLANKDACPHSSPCPR